MIECRDEAHAHEVAKTCSIFEEHVDNPHAVLRYKGMWYVAPCLGGRWSTLLNVNSSTEDRVHVMVLYKKGVINNGYMTERGQEVPFIQNP